VTAIADGDLLLHGWWWYYSDTK